MGLAWIWLLSEGVGFVVDFCCLPADTPCLWREKCAIITKKMLKGRSADLVKDCFGGGDCQFWHGGGNAHGEGRAVHGEAEVAR